MPPEESAMSKKRTGIPESTRCMLWGRASGRCEFEGCNRKLSSHPKTGETVNLAEAAHIIGFSEKGPRGEKDLSDDLAQDVDNLMLLCRLCHKLIDANEQRYPVSRLKRMKRRHEQRIARVTGIGQERESHMLLYGANVGDHSCPVFPGSAAPAVLADERFPAAQAFELGMVNSSFRDCSAQFWRIEAENLRALFRERVSPLLASGGIRHLSVFGLAPQPLLVLLGYLLCDIHHETQVYQLHREPPGWLLQSHPEGFDFIVRECGEAAGPPALVLSLSATVTDDRVHSVLGDDAAIWRMSIPEPGNDFLRSPQQLQQFRQAMRRLMDRIKARHGQGALLHVFPAMPVAAAVEMGRVIMPKADMPLRVYDQNNDQRGFIPALDIGAVEGGKDD